MRELTFANPIGITHIGDPFIFRDIDGTFYLYATSEGLEKGFYVWSSQDLSHWTRHENCYAYGPRSFGVGSFWAPEVIRCGDRYVMH